MPRRSKMTAVEFLIVMAIVGIVVSILLPALGQARRREAAARRHSIQTAPSDSRASEGQLNTIEVSEVTQNEPHAQGPQYLAPAVRLLPLAAAAFFVFFVRSRLRRRRSGRRGS